MRVPAGNRAGLVSLIFAFRDRHRVDAEPFHLKPSRFLHGRQPDPVRLETIDDQL
jgi:hypothetical protein